MTTKAKTTKKTTISSSIAPVVAKVQETAKLAYAKGAVALADAKTFTKGNVDAVVESGKILGAGLKVIGNEYAAEGRTVLGTVKADLDAYKAVKSPADLFKLNSTIFSRNLKTAMEFGSKNSDAMVKLAKAASAPLSKRVEVAVSAVRKAA